DISQATCVPSITVAPLSRVQAVQLEQLRQSYAPVVAALTATVVARESIALLWTFSIKNFPEMGFDPAALPPLVPLPNDLAKDPTTGLLKIPIDPASPAAQQEFTTDFLNTLDGYPVATGGAALTVNGDVDPLSLNYSSVKVINLAGGAAPTPALIYDPASKNVVIAPPAGGWPKGGKFA